MLGSEGLELGSEKLGTGGWDRGGGIGVGGVGVGRVGVRRVGVRVLGSGGVGVVGVGKVVVLASNGPRIKSSSRQIVMYDWAFGANGHFGQMGHVWDKWACGDWDK